jgi:hypothetical protein
VDSITKGFKPQTLLVRNTECNIASNKEKVLHRWYEYYEKHYELQDVPNNDSGEEWTMYVQTTETPKDVDIEREISKFKNGKATVHDKIPAELVKEGGKELR